MIRVEVKLGEQIIRASVTETRVGELMTAIRVLFPNWSEVSIKITRPHDQSDPTVGKERNFTPLYKGDGS